MKQKSITEDRTSLQKKDKRNKRQSQIISGKSIVKEINTQNITLLPFTIDDHGAMGPLAQKCFNDVKTIPEIKNIDDNPTFTEEGAFAYKRGRTNNKLTSLFKRSNKGYRKTNKDKWFGSTYQLVNSSNWGKRNLAMNTNLALLKHIK